VTAAPTIETRRSWLVATAAVAMIAVAQGGPLSVVVGMPALSAHFGSRSWPATASALAFLGTGVGGVLCGWLASRIGMRRVAMLAALVLAAGMVLAASGSSWGLLAGIAIGAGLFGTGALFAPLIAHVSLWFDRRRGSALALVASGQYVAGAVWPPIFERAIAAWGWQASMLAFAALAVAIILPLAAVAIARPPMPVVVPGMPAPRAGAAVLGMRPNLALALIAIASFLCCVPMAIPSAHLVAFCVDLGLSAQVGAAMLSLLLLCAFVSRQVWGAISDRIGGLSTVLIGNLFQVAGMAAFWLTTDEAGLFLVAALYGLGFGGIVPAYVLAVRALFPVEEAHWRIPTLLMISLSGMAFGAWWAGFLYDRLGSYAAAWQSGIVINLLQIALVAFLLGRARHRTE
jgi:MFS family permease